VRGPAVSAMRIAALQMEALAGNVAANLATIAAAAAESAAAGAGVLVAPELAVPGYGVGDALRELAEPMDGAQVDALAAAAAANGIAIVAGFAERAGDAIHNAAAFVDPSGRRVVYRKRQLYGAYEKALFAPGGSLAPLVNIAGVKVGLLVCFDVEFPESVRALALAGAEVVLVPTALPESDHAAFIADKMIPVRAFENQVAVAYANWAGRDARFVYAGRSCIVTPDGRDMARAPVEGPTLLVADYTPDEFADSRAANPYLDELLQS
jgi:5-aminopentanamidase